MSDGKHRRLTIKIPEQAVRGKARGLCWKKLEKCGADVNLRIYDLRLRLANLFRATIAKNEKGRAGVASLERCSKRFQVKGFKERLTRGAKRLKPEP
jgi:hypothetical protein